MAEENSGLKIVSIGGGTGLSTLLKGLKKFVDCEVAPDEESMKIETLTAIVTVTDDGGSSGRLREEFQILPPGDIRNCLVALAEDERLLTRLLRYRFESDGQLSGHSFGNIFLTALTGVTGDFLEAIKVTSEVLAIKGRIFPSTMDDVALEAELADGRIIRGESRISNARSIINRLWLSRSDCQPLPEALEALSSADIITIGPGSLYTSIIPNLLVEGMVDALRLSPAIKVYICNVMTQPGETEGFSVEDHVRKLGEYSPGLELDYVIVNSRPISPTLREKYLADGAVQVSCRSCSGHQETGWPGAVQVVRSLKLRHGIVCGDMLDENDVVRHDPDKLARIVLTLQNCGAMVAGN